MLSVILTMFMVAESNYLQEMRFSSLAACEAYAQQMYKEQKVSGSYPRMKHHFCFEDF